MKGVRRDAARHVPRALDRYHRGDTFEERAVAQSTRNKVVEAVVHEKHALAAPKPRRADVPLRNKHLNMIKQKDVMKECFEQRTCPVRHVLPSHCSNARGRVDQLVNSKINAKFMQNFENGFLARLTHLSRDGGGQHGSHSFAGTGVGPYHVGGLGLKLGVYDQERSACLHTSADGVAFSNDLPSLRQIALLSEISRVNQQIDEVRIVR